MEEKGKDRGKGHPEGGEGVSSAYRQLSESGTPFLPPPVRITSPEFTMGSDYMDIEKPPHTVRITRVFYLGVYPVTQGQYLAVVGQNPSCFKGSDDLPVEGVSWLDAVQFCTKLSERENRKPDYWVDGGTVTVLDGDGYRLPTEAEWEYACRAGSTTRYPFGDSKAKLREYAWFSIFFGVQTHPVGQKQPNRWGLYDMLGNVWEWCQDGYDGSYYKKSPRNDPPGPSEASARVIRGGGWDSFPSVCRPACRMGERPEARFTSLGFRVATVRLR